MNKFIKGFSFLILLVGVSFFIWNSNKKEPVALTPEELMKTMIAEKIEPHPVGSKKFEPIFKGIDTSDKLESYKKQAVDSNKTLLVYFYINGCYFCEKMKNITFADTRVQEELSKNYIAISINYTRYKSEFNKMFPLRATPAIIFFDRDGKRMEEDYGYQGAEEFFDKLELLTEPF